MVLPYRRPTNDLKKKGLRHGADQAGHVAFGPTKDLKKKGLRHLAGFVVIVGTGPTNDLKKKRLRLRGLYIVAGWHATNQRPEKEEIKTTAFCWVLGESLDQPTT